MKLKKIIAGVAATAMAVATCASFSVSAADSYNAFLMYCDNQYLWGNWNTQASGNGFGKDAKITKDGTYTVSMTSDTVKNNGEKDNPNYGFTNSAVSANVFCVDITGILKTKKFNASKEKENAVTKNGTFSEKDITCKLKSIKLDGKNFKFDASKILYGDIEDDNTNYRIEIYNIFGETKDDPPIDITSFGWAKSIEVTFSISGIGGGADKTTKAAKNTNDTQPATTAAVGGGADTSAANTSSNTNTGAETGLALVGLALAGGAIVLTKKRK